MESEDMRPCKKPYVSHDDNISTLPDDVVGLILSRIPIKDAVRTSVLSRDWKYKWTSICDIQIDDEEDSLFGETDFVNFVTWILVRTCNLRKLTTFSLTCENNYHIKYFETWISWVLMRNVENLKIVASEIQRIDSTGCFSGWTSLTKLKLYLSCTLVLPFDIRFPNLKRLCLNSGVYGNIKIKPERIPTTGRIILNFPVLQILVLRQCEWMDVNFVEIHAPELIRFQTSCLEEIKNYEIKIFGTKLAMFDSSRGSINNFDLHTLSTSCARLSHDSFVFRKKEDQKILLTRTHKILQQFPHLTCLKLSGEIVEALVPLPESNFGVFPIFNQLRELHLEACQIKETLIALRTLPPLESFYFNSLHWEDEEDWGKPWPPEILSNLKKVKLTQFRDSDCGFDFSKFILKNATNLKEMSVVIYGNSFMTVNEATCRLSKVKPKSSRCRLTVSKGRAYY